jgi:1-acyl-sn-glycerol-3-phosphate acyltransferase
VTTNDTHDDESNADPNAEPDAEITKWDPALTKNVMDVIRPILKAWHRTDVRGLDNVPPGGALVVSNHSGGVFPMDVPVFTTGFYDRYGYDRPVYTLSFDLVLTGLTADFFRKTGYIKASHTNADQALRSGGLVVVFPGGDHDVYRPSTQRNKIDFGGRTGYVKAAINAGVPIVPMVAIGGQETQFYLTRGSGLAKLLRLDKLMRANVLPFTIGFPFGLSAVFPINVPLPTKIVMQVLPQIDIAAEFGEDPDIDEVDSHVRRVMQAALDKLAKERRLPVIG